MIRCVLLDDEQLALDLLEEMIRKTELLEIVLKTTDPFEAIRYLDQQPVDLLYLDINMPDLNGMELASLIPPQVKIIFTTAYSEYALAGYEKNTLDYVLKPITYERFFKSLQKIKNAFGTTSTLSPVVQKSVDSSFFKIGKDYVQVQFDTILFLESKGDYVYCHLEKEKLLIHDTLKAVLNKLGEPFIRVHHSYVVNFRQIKKVEGNQLYFANGSKISVSQPYREGFKHLLKNQTFNP